jgi:hypothetical protein
MLPFYSELDQECRCDYFLKYIDFSAAIPLIFSVCPRSVLRIRGVNPESRILTFIPDPATGTNFCSLKFNKIEFFLFLNR